MKALAGLAIVAAHLVGFVWLANQSRGAPLSLVAPAATSPAGGGPGLVHTRTSASYRGGYTRSLGATQLVGPFQDPAAPACTGRIVIGQRLLDDGTDAPTSIAGVMKQTIDKELRGLDVFPIGAYRRIKALSLRWVKADPSKRELRMIGKAGAPDGFVRVTATLAFARVDVPVHVIMIPERDAARLKFRLVAEADLDFDNRVIQWVSDKVGADEIATRIARDQIDDVLVTTFAPPPPFELSEGQTLQFTYCDGPVEIADGSYGALPFGIAIGRLAGAPTVLPPRFGNGSRALPTQDTTLAIDLDVDALNAILFELWRTGWLDKRLGEVGLDRRFNTDPIVTEYLSIRISPVRLALPPVISRVPAGAVDRSRSPASASLAPSPSLRLAADARVAIDDGATTTIGRVYGALDFRFAPSTSSRALPLAVTLGALELSCERDAVTLVPCYGDLVSTLRDRGDEFHGALTTAFAGLLTDIFVDRQVGAEGLPAELVIDRVVPALTDGGTLHLDLAGRLVVP